MRACLDSWIALGRAYARTHDLTGRAMAINETFAMAALGILSLSITLLIAGWLP